jgi:hypothetical protein
MFLEALGAAQFDARNGSASLGSFRDALALTSNPETRRRLELEIAAASRLTTASPEVVPKSVEAVPVMPDSRIPADNATEPDSSLVKPAPSLPEMPAEIPSLPYPDL